LEHASTLGAESLSDSGSRSPGALDFGRPGRDRGARVGHGWRRPKGVWNSSQKLQDVWLSEDW